MNNSGQKHISFSELKLWKECPHKRKLVYEDKLKGFVGNIYTAFGTAVHLACEKGYTDNSNAEQRKEIFVESFEQESNALSLERNSDWDSCKAQMINISSLIGKHVLGAGMHAVNQTK